MPSPLFSGGCAGGIGEFWSDEVALFPSAALFAAHLAFIAAASCARRSGERFSFLLAFLALLGFFAPVVGSRDFFAADAVARAADLLAAFNSFADSGCWIFFFNFFNFMIVLLLAPNGD